ncbi:MAG: DUF1211 domain-containing protein [Gemmatimonadetes bacterium]|nr:DUF1211 domain-containing protein [Gemmatimonadota bacterium]
MVRSAMMQRGVGERGDFRWRGKEVSRQEALADAVFGFAITLLVVSLEVPRTFAEMLVAMRGFFAFAASFALLYLVWHHHYRFYRRYGLEDPATTVLNGVLLFVVLFFVYPLKFVFNLMFNQIIGVDAWVAMPDGTRAPVLTREQAPTMMLVFGLGYAAVFLVFALLYHHAYRRRETLDLTPLEAYHTLDNVRENLLNVAIAALSIWVAYRGSRNAPMLSGLTYALVGPVMTMHGFWSARRRKRVAVRVEAAAES